MKVKDTAPSTIENMLVTLNTSHLEMSSFNADTAQDPISPFEPQSFFTEHSPTARASSCRELGVKTTAVWEMDERLVECAFIKGSRNT